MGGAGTPEQSERLALVERALDPRYAERSAVDVAAMPGRLPAEVLPAGAAPRLCLAVEADFVGGVWLDLREGPSPCSAGPGSGRTGFLRAVAELARRSDRPPTQVVLVGPRAAEWADDPAFDVVASQPAEAIAVLDTLAVTEPGAWNLLLVDDAHEWERGAEPRRNWISCYAREVSGTFATHWLLASRLRRNTAQRSSSPETPTRHERDNTWRVPYGPPGRDVAPCCCHRTSPTEHSRR